MKVTVTIEMEIKDEDYEEGFVVEDRIHEAIVKFSEITHGNIIKVSEIED